MHRFTTLIGALFAASLPSQAEAGSAAYVSKAGTATSVCAATAPCGTIGNAVTAAGAGGVVFCIDKGSYGGATITASVSIFCGDGLWEAPGVSVVVTLPNATDKVILEGLTSDGLVIPGDAILFNGKGSLDLRNIRLGNGGSSGNLLGFLPNGASSLHVSDSFFYDNANGAGIFIQPTILSAYANVHIRTTKFSRNQNGILADGSFTNIGVNVNLDDSASSDNVQNGFKVVGAVAPAITTLSVRNTQISGNLTNGVLSTGAQGVIELHNCMFVANFNAILTQNGGNVRSYGTNEVSLNGGNNVFSFTGSVGLQ